MLSCVSIIGRAGADTDTSTGRLIAVLGGLADVGRDLIRTRTAEGENSRQDPRKAAQMGRPLPSPDTGERGQPGGARRALRCKNWRKATTSGYRQSVVQRALSDRHSGGHEGSLDAGSHDDKQGVVDFVNPLQF
jgi:hypothetical protein